MGYRGFRVELMLLLTNEGQCPEAEETLVAVLYDACFDGCKYNVTQSREAQEILGVRAVVHNYM